MGSRKGGDDQLRELGDRLGRRGWDARVESFHIGVDLDVRLTVAGPGSPAVELLGDCGGLPCHERWEAVRVTDEGRAVWSGPGHDCVQDELIAFVEALLRDDEEQLDGRYTRLG